MNVIVELEGWYTEDEIRNTDSRIREEYPDFIFYFMYSLKYSKWWWFWKEKRNRCLISIHLPEDSPNY